jgi:hypothetical protein
MDVWAGRCHVSEGAGLRKRSEHTVVEATRYFQQIIVHRGNESR